MLILTFFLSMLMVNSNTAQPLRGILHQKAPDWEVNEWFQLPAGAESLDLADFQGKVIYLYCFQSWCPGCHKYGFPTLKKVLARFQNDADVAIVAIQTTFEGFSHNGVKQAREVAQKYNLKIPIGQSGSPDRRSKLMSNYRTGGTPWTIIIDKGRIVRYNDFHIEPDAAIRLIETLKQKKSEQ